MSILLCFIVETLCRSIEQFKKPVAPSLQQRSSIEVDMNNALTRVNSFCHHYVKGLKAEMSREAREEAGLSTFLDNSSSPNNKGNHTSNPNNADRSSRVMDTTEPGQTTFHSALLSSDDDSYENNPLTLYSVF